MKRVNILFDDKTNTKIKFFKKKIEELNKLSEKEISFSQLIEKIELKEKIIIIFRETNVSMDKFRELNNYYYSKNLNFLKLQRKAIEIAEKLNQSTDVLKLNIV